MANIEQTVADFNSVFLDLCRNLAEVCPNSIIGQNINLVEGAVANPKNKTKFIDIFVNKVLQYKDKIDNSDEEFFLRKSYDDDVESDNSLMNKVFEFKSIWMDLKKENKELVIQYMQILCELSQNYFMVIYENS
jgi:hypothetical protein